MSGVARAAEPADASTCARGSSFNAAMRILPRPRREAMFEIYSFCRAVDDIADEAGPRQPASRRSPNGGAISARFIQAGVPQPARARGCEVSPWQSMLLACGARIFVP